MSAEFDIATAWIVAPCLFYVAFTIARYGQFSPVSFSEAARRSAPNEVFSLTEPFGEMPGSFVVMFFQTKAGELRCRVTDVASREAWIARSALDLWHLLVERRDAQNGSENPP